MDNITNISHAPFCPIEGWDLIMPVSQSKYQEIWTACSNESGEPDGLVRILNIPAYDGEAELLRQNGFTDSQILQRFDEYADKCIADAEKLINSDFEHLPEILDVKSVRTEGGAKIYILSAYYPTFSEYYSGRKINRATLLSLACDMCDAISEYSSLDMRHNNVQLENVYVNKDGRCLLGNPMFEPQLTSRLLNPDDSRLLRFIAPELARGEEADIRSDIYSIGLTMYFKFNNNRLPFVISEKGLVTKKEADDAIVSRIDGKPLPAPCKADSRLSSVILKACAHSPDDRYSSPQDMSEAIREYAAAAGITLNIQKPSDTMPETHEKSQSGHFVFAENEALTKGGDSNRNETFGNIVYDYGDASSETASDKQTERSVVFTVNDGDENNNIATSDKLIQPDPYGKNYSENGYFDEDGNFIHSADTDTLRSQNSHNGDELTEIKPKKKRKKKESDPDETDTGINESEIHAAGGDFSVQSEGQESENTDISDGSNYSGESENESDRFGNIPILKICLFTVALIAILVVLIVCMQKCGGNTGRKPSPDTSPDTSAVTDAESSPTGTYGIEMPDLSGKSEEDALVLLRKSGYSNDPVILGNYSYTAAEGTVIGQFPEAGITFGADDTVELTLSLGKAPNNMPSMVGLTENDASERLATLGFGNVIVLHAYSASVPEGSVAYQSIAEGSDIVSDIPIYITVSSGVMPDGFIPIESMSIGDDSFALKSGESETMKLSIYPENATEKEVFWTSDNPSAVTVDQTGQVSAIADGSATITVFSADGEHSASCKVEIRDNVVKVAGIGFRINETTLSVGASESHSPWLTPSNVTNKYVTFSSSNPSVVTVNAYGQITAIAPGSAVITARSSDGDFTASYTVNIPVPSGKSVTPGIVTMSESDAAAAITAAGLSYNTVYAVSEVPKGTVISQSIASGTIVNEKTVVTITVSNGTSQWSEWSDTAPDGNTAQTEERTLWSYRTKNETVQNTYPTDGLTVDDSKTVYGEWSEFGQWQSVPIIESDTERVETKTVYRTRSITPWSEWGTAEIIASDTVSVETRTRYIYRTYETKIIEGYEYNDWSDWSDWSDSLPDTDKIEFRQRTEYRSRPANPYGEWSDWSDTPAESTSASEVETSVQYRSSTRPVTYTCYSYTEWSDWSETKPAENENTEIRSVTQYRFKITE